MQANPEPLLSPVRARVANACDVCKARKVKCDGAAPCAYCIRHRVASHCRFSPPRSRRRRLRGRQGAASDPSESTPSRLPVPSSRIIQSASRTTATGSRGTSRLAAASSSPPGSPPPASSPRRDGRDDETEVPREARLVCDPHGKLMFIGDCAPLSFFQSVRQLVVSRVDPAAFAPQTRRYSLLENSHPRRPAPPGLAGGPPPVDARRVEGAVRAYHATTAGLVDLFDDDAALVDDLTRLAGAYPRPHQKTAAADDMGSAVLYLVLALGFQGGGGDGDAALAQTYFDHAHGRAVAHLGADVTTATVQAFLLVTLYMLGACQTNGAFLFVGIAARAAYAIGLHRAEVNARFGPPTARRRDRLWTSLRVVDLFLSTCMGRPPATSDVDCTVSYRDDDGDDDEAGGPPRQTFDLLHASAQIFLVVERVVQDVYSRRKISLRLTEGLSRDLRAWSARWAACLGRALAEADDAALRNGACRVLSSYYYAVMLVTRPFLMCELPGRVAPAAADDATSAPPPRAKDSQQLPSAKARLADACIDAASLMVGPVQALIERGVVTPRSPLLVSWLFASSLVLGLGLLGGFGRILEKHCRQCIACLDFFAPRDAIATQYARIAQSLLAAARDYLDRRDTRERQLRTESSAQLFGLLPRGEPHRDGAPAAASSRSASRSAEPWKATATPVAAQSADAHAVAHAVAHAATQTEDPARPPPASQHLDFGFGSPFFDMSDALNGTPEWPVPDLPMEWGRDEALGGLNLFPLLDIGNRADLDQSL